MSENVHGKKMVNEETKAAKLFIWLFYVIYFTYELFYHVIGPMASKEKVSINDGGLGVWLYILLFGILPFAISLIKKGKPQDVKYLFFAIYTILDFIDVIMIYSEKSGQTVSFGNVIDLFLILFSSIFVNKRFVWIISIGTMLKYALIGVILKEFDVLLPIGTMVFLFIFSLVILSRFLSYINSLTSAYDEIRDKEKLVFIGQMATAIGHEIRNPLSALKGFTQLQSERDKSKENFYPIMIQEIDRINTIVDDLMIIGRPKSPDFKFNNYKNILEYVTKVTTPLAENVGTKIVLKQCEDVQQIECDEKQMKQVLINVIKNAIESMQNGGVVEVSYGIQENNKLKVDIQDQGCGMDSEKIKKLGEPFYTTKPEGTGLGLMVTKKIIEDHQGELRFESQKGKGTRVEILIPIKQK